MNCPSQTFVENIGHDGSGTHCGETDIFKSKLSLNANMKFQTTIQESKLAIDKIKIFYKKNKKSFFERVVNKLKGLMK